MSKFLISLCIIAAPSFFGPVYSEGRGQESGTVNSVLARMDRNRRELRSLRGGISMEKYNAQIDDRDTSKGTVIYMPGKGRNSFVRVDWEEPQHETLSVLDGKYSLYRPRLNIVYEGNANSQKNKVSGLLGFGLGVSRQELAARFEPVQYLGHETLYGGVGTDHLKLIPKGDASYSYAEIWVDGGGLPVQTKIIEKNDDATTVRLTDVQKNPRVSLDDFKLKLPSGVRVVHS